MSQGLGLGSQLRDSARLCLSRSGVRIEPGATHMEGIAELVSKMGVVLEASCNGRRQHRGQNPAGPSHQGTREARSIFREIVREL